VTEAVAIVISESTGDVRIFKDGMIFMEIEKPSS
jgi:DNA integrity scanning protein DisA with diadenylate cyclase activity